MDHTKSRLFPLSTYKEARIKEMLRLQVTGSNGEKQRIFFPYHSDNQPNMEKAQE